MIIIVYPFTSALALLPAAEIWLVTSEKIVVSDGYLSRAPINPHMNYRITSILVACILVIASAGCMSARTDTPRGMPDTVYASDDGMHISEGKATIARGASYAYQSTNTPESFGSSSGTDQKIIRTATVDLEVTNVAGSIEAIKSLASSKGGFISSTYIHKTYNNRMAGTVIIRIPAAEFENSLAGVKAAGTVKSASAQGQDVSEEYVDLEVQLASYQNQLSQYNVILKQCTKVEDLIKVQTQIDQVQINLDRLKGRIKYLDNRIDFSTITVNLDEPEPVGGQTGFSFVSTLNEGIAGLVGMVSALIVALFTFLPLIAIGGAAYGIYRWKKGRDQKSAPTDVLEKK
jgi:hypothetical protein